MEHKKGQHGNLLHLPCKLPVTGYSSGWRTINLSWQAGIASYTVDGMWSSSSIVVRAWMPLACKCPGVAALRGASTVAGLKLVKLLSSLPPQAHAEITRASLCPISISRSIAPNWRPCHAFQASSCAPITQRPCPIAMLRTSMARPC